jgi:hypothetical protein
MNIILRIARQLLKMAFYLPKCLPIQDGTHGFYPKGMPLFALCAHL